MAKVVVRIKGGLGNQLFMYSAARRLAVVNGAQLAIDPYSGFVRDVDYRRSYQLDHFSIGSEVTKESSRSKKNNRILFRLRRLLEAFVPYRHRTYLRQSGNDFDARLLGLRTKKTITLEGYWQSQKYFEDIEATIRADLKIVPPKDQENTEMMERIESKVSVAVHVRFFDEPGKERGYNTSLNYYRRAIERMEALVEGAHYFVFSDRPDAALDMVGLGSERVTVVSHNQDPSRAYCDLWLMTHCKHFIIANSTFSWWAAWLATFPKKVVIAPAMVVSGVTAWGFTGLLPEQWLTIGAGDPQVSV